MKLSSVFKVLSADLYRFVSVPQSNPSALVVPLSNFNCPLVDILVVAMKLSSVFKVLAADLYRFVSVPHHIPFV